MIKNTSQQSLRILLALGILLLIIPPIVGAFTNTTKDEIVVNSKFVVKPGSALEFSFIAPSPEARLYLIVQAEGSTPFYLEVEENATKILYASMNITGGGRWSIPLGDAGLYNVRIYYVTPADADLAAAVFAFIEYQVPRANTPQGYALASLSTLGALLAGYAAGRLAGGGAGRRQVQSMEEKA